MFRRPEHIGPVESWKANSQFAQGGAGVTVNRRDARFYKKGFSTMGWLGSMFKGGGYELNELALRLGVSEQDLASIQIDYTEFTIPKRSGGVRRISAPSRELKTIQRRILRRLLALLVTHESVTGFERGQSIATNAARHVGRAVVIRLDIRDFFTSTKAKRINKFFRKIGWNREAAQRLTELCTHQGGLPQGAPTSPRLANLVNYKLDLRLFHLAQKFGATYTRYADDLTFSMDDDRSKRVKHLISLTKFIVKDEGYEIHSRRKLHVRRRHQRQCVTGLVVNERVQLPRETRRRLRSIEHRLAVHRQATLTETQLAGWRALESMIENQQTSA